MHLPSCPVRTRPAQLALLLGAATASVLLTLASSPARAQAGGDALANSHWIGANINAALRRSQAAMANSMAGGGAADLQRYAITVDPMVFRRARAMGVPLDLSVCSTLINSGRSTSDPGPSNRTASTRSTQQCFINGLSNGG